MNIITYDSKAYKDFIEAYKQAKLIVDPTISLEEQDKAIGRLEELSRSFMMPQDGIPHGFLFDILYNAACRDISLSECVTILECYGIKFIVD